MPTTKYREDKAKTMVSNAIHKQLGDLNVDLIVTADYIASRYKRPILGVAEMADLLQVKRESIFTYIQQNKMPFKVTKMGKDWITTPYAVASFIIDNAQDKSEFVND